MSKVAIVGAGEIGTGIAKFILLGTDSEIILIDSDQELLAESFERLQELPRPQHRVVFSPVPPVEVRTVYNEEQLEALLRSSSCSVLAYAGPDQSALDVARIALKLGLSYVDCVKDSEVANSILELSVSRVTFVPQAGLAPGLSDYIALSILNDVAEPSKLLVRAGTMPQVAFGPAYFTITEAAEDVVDAYFNTTKQKVQHQIHDLPALDDAETFFVDGNQFECFTSSTGLGALEAFDEVPTVQFKRIALPGHLEAIQKLLSRVHNAEDAVQLLLQSFTKTKNDFVLIVAHVENLDGDSSSAWLRFYPSEDLDLSAYALTTAGTVAAVIELILASKLEGGALDSSKIPFQDFLNTSSAQLVFQHLSND